METETKFPQNQAIKTQSFFFRAQVFLRVMIITTTLAAASVMFTSKQSVVLFGSFFEARYSYSPSLKFFAYANVVACVFTVFSLLYLFMVGRNGSNPANYFILFLHDMLMMCLVLAGCGAATTIGYIGKYGNSHVGWMPICDEFSKYCSKVTSSVVLSYLSVLFLMILTIFTANRSRQIHV